MASARRPERWAGGSPPVAAGVEGDHPAQRVRRPHQRRGGPQWAATASSSARSTATANRPRIEAIATAIRDLSPNVEVFNPSADIRHGQAWRPQLYDALRASDMLLLVYTDPLDDWSWCTYEAGLFASLEGDPTDAEPTVCLHHPDAEPPRQLQHLQCVEARPAAVEAFLRTLFTTTDITRERWPLEVKLASEELVDAAAQICAQFAVVDRYFATYRLVLDLSRDDACESGLPESARGDRRHPRHGRPVRSRRRRRAHVG